jgi:hypothetical protein
MRKPIAKLVLSKETIRALIATDLSRVKGMQGDAVLLNDATAKVACPAQQLVRSP